MGGPTPSRTPRDGAQRSDGPGKDAKSAVRRRRSWRPLPIVRSWAPASAFHAQRATVRHPAGEVPRGAGRGSRRWQQRRSLLRHPLPKQPPMQPARHLVAGPLRPVRAAPSACCVVSADNGSLVVLHLSEESQPTELRRFATLVITHGSGSVLSVSALSGAGLAWASQSPRSYRSLLRRTPTAHARAGLGSRRRKRAYSRRHHSARRPWRHRCEP